MGSLILHKESILISAVDKTLVHANRKSIYKRQSPAQSDKGHEMMLKKDHHISATMGTASTLFKFSVKWLISAVHTLIDGKSWIIWAI